METEAWRDALIAVCNQLCAGIALPNVMGATVSPGAASAARGALGLQLHCGGGGGGYLGAAESAFCMLRFLSRGLGSERGKSSSSLLFLAEATGL